MKNILHCFGVCVSLLLEMKDLNKLSSKALLLGAMIFALSGAKAQILVSDTIETSAEPVGVFNSTLSGTSVEDFNGLSAGDYKNLSWSGVGSIDNVSLINNNQYGGIPGEKTYAVQSASVGNGVKNTTISFNNVSSYFGLYWSAGDAANTLSFYNGNTLVGQFSTASLMNKLPKGYDGNPNPANLHQDSGEPFGFVNFSALNGTAWNKVVLTDTTGSGFESDNWTTRVNGWNPLTDGTLPGTPVALVTTTDGVSSSSMISSVTTSGDKVAVTTFVSGNSGATVAASFVPAAPGAPAPPMTACLAFAGVLLLQALRRKQAQA